MNRPPLPEPFRKVRVAAGTYLHFYVRAQVYDYVDACVAEERERCAKLVADNYGWRADTRKYCDDLGEMLREAPT